MAQERPALGCHHGLFMVTVSASPWLLVGKGSHQAPITLGPSISVTLLLSSLAGTRQPVHSPCPGWRCVLGGLLASHTLWIPACPHPGALLCYMQGNSGISIQAHFSAWPLLHQDSKSMFARSPGADRVLKSGSPKSAHKPMNASYLASCSHLLDQTLRPVPWVVP